MQSWSLSQGVLIDFSRLSGKFNKWKRGYHQVSQGHYKVLCTLCTLERIISPVSGRETTIRSQGILQEVKFVVWSRLSGRSSEWESGYHELPQGY